MSGEIPEYDIQANIAREAQKASQAQRTRAQREALMQSGLRDTGTYVQEGLINPAEQNFREQEDLERRLTADRAMLASQRQAQGAEMAGNLMGLQQSGQGMASQERIAFGGMGSQERMQEKELASRERLGFADLNVREQQLAQQGQQFTDKLSFDKYALESGYDQAEIDRVWQSIEAEKQRGLTKELAYADLNVRERQLAQQGEQFESRLEFDQWATEQGMLEGERQRVWESIENKKQRDITRELEYANLDVRGKELAQQAEQFSSRMAFDEYALEAGFDEAERERAWQAAESLQERESREKIAYADLDMQERQLAQQAEQFGSRLEFDQWAAQAQLDDADKDRVWRAAQASKQMVHEKDVTQMQINQDQWKQTRVEYLTELGWDRDEAMAEANMEHQKTLAELDRSLTREIEGGRLNQADRELALQASQFDSQLEWEKDAQLMQMQLANAEKIWQASQNALDRDLTREVEEGRMSQEDARMVEMARQFDSQLEWEQEAQKMQLQLENAKTIWQSAESAKDRALQTTQMSLDRNLQREIEAGRLSLEDRSLAQQATQFATEMDFRSSELAATLDEAAKQRVWQASQGALDRQHDMQMEAVAQRFADKQMNLQAIMPMLQSMDPNQAWGVVQQLADVAGVEIPDVSTDRKVSSTIATLKAKLESGEDFGLETYELDGKELTEYEALKEYGTFPDQADIPLSNIHEWTVDARDTRMGPKAWRFSDATWSWLQNNVGTTYRGADGELYKVTDYWEPGESSGDRDKRAYIMVENVGSGATKKIGG